MALYILDRTPLRAIGKLSAPPRKGDAIVYLRPGQDPDGMESEKLKSEGLDAVWGETLLDMETSWQCDRIGGDFLSRWYLKGNIDVTHTGQLSIGKLMDWQLGRLLSPMYLIRTGEIVRRALMRFPEFEEIYSDVEDGEGIDRVLPKFRPLADTVRHVGRSMQRPVQQLEPVEPLHPLLIRNKEGSVWNALIRLMGGLRPRYLIPRIRRIISALARQERLPAVYFFLGRGTETIVNILRQTGHFKIYTSGADVQGSEALRQDHLLAFPSYAEIKAAHRSVQHLRGMAANPESSPIWVLNNIVYDHLLAKGALAVTRHLFWPNLICMAQTKKLVAYTEFAGFVINGEGGFLMATIVDLNRHSGRSIYYIGHALNVFRSQSTGMAHNSPHVTYFASGSDQTSEFGVHLSEQEKPRRIVLGNPLTVQMNGVRNRRSHPHEKRILVLGTGFAGHATASRARSAERFLADAFLVARNLAVDGWQVTYRGHPGHPQLMERGIAKALKMEDQILWDARPEFSQSLLSHDVVITAFSSTFYQSLWAGWPTIYYDPKFISDSTPENFFRDDIYLGLPVARDINWPVCHDPVTLEKMVTDSRKSGTLTASFPETFSSKYAPRFIGPDPANADQLIAEFICEDLRAV